MYFQSKKKKKDKKTKTLQVFAIKAFVDEN